VRLQEAVAQYRELGEAADLETARWLANRLDEDDYRRLGDPQRGCGRDCQVATKKSRYDEHCPCIATVQALRLRELAIGEIGPSPERVVTRHRHECPACGKPFVSRRKEARYCPVCAGEKKGEAA
jgi:hypothetical protein